MASYNANGAIQGGKKFKVLTPQSSTQKKKKECKWQVALRKTESEFV